MQFIGFQKIYSHFHMKLWVTVIFIIITSACDQFIAFVHWTAYWYQLYPSFLSD